MRPDHVRYKTKAWFSVTVFDQREVNMKEIKIHRISYSPGYCDMLGGYHGSTLKQDKDGNWTFVCSDRNVHNEPMVTTTCAVSAEDVARFEEFIKSNKIIRMKRL